MDLMVQRLQEALDRAVDSGEECACQLAVYRHGRLVCDLVAGTLSNERRTKVDTETLFPVFSVGKGVLSTLFHIFVQQGRIHPDEPVVKYWPEYGQNGKEATLIRHMLSHRTGLQKFPAEFPLLQMFNWETAAATLEASAPLDRIGGRHHYHGYTFGILVGQLLERALGVGIRDLLRQEILESLSIDTFFYGIPLERLDNVARIVPYTQRDGSVDCTDQRLCFNDVQILRGLNPSANAACNARALARIYASMIGDGVDGVRLVDDATLEQALILQRSEDDDPPGDEWDKFGLGYALVGPVAPWNRMFGHGGACGAEGFADRESGYAVGFTKNKLNATHPDHPTRNAISEILGIPPRIW